MSFINGYYKVPDGVYFGRAEFTILAWAKVRDFIADSRIIDFSHNISKNSGVFSLSYATNGNPYYAIRINKILGPYFKSSSIHIV
jgi:hypothetical protein